MKTKHHTWTITLAVLLFFLGLGGGVLAASSCSEASLSNEFSFFKIHFEGENFYPTGKYSDASFQCQSGEWVMIAQE